MGSVGDGEPHDQPPGEREHARPQDDALPLEAHAADEVRTRRTDRERPHQHPERHASAGGEPPRHHLEPARVDAGKGDTGEQAQDEGDGEVPFTERDKSRVRHGADDRGDEKQPPGGDDVGDAEHRRPQCPDHEPDLNGKRQPGRLTGAQRPFDLEPRSYGRGRKPQGEHEQLAPGDDSERPALSRHRGRRCRGPGFLTPPPCLHRSPRQSLAPIRPAAPLRAHSTTMPSPGFATRTPPLQR